MNVQNKTGLITKAVEVNGQPMRVVSHTLSDLVVELGYEDRPVATALNQSFIRKADRADTPINDADRVEILVPMQGG